MSVDELLPELRSLSRADRLRVVQCLVTDLVREERLALLEPEKACPAWTPYGAFEAAATLDQALRQEKEGA
jgi:hypothetical protein